MCLSHKAFPCVALLVGGKNTPEKDSHMEQAWMLVGNFEFNP